jgi:hypothetical protein
MGAIDQTRCNQILDAILATTTLTASTTGIHIRLMTANGSVSANGTELGTSGGYTAGTGTATVTWAAASAASAASNQAYTVTNMPATTIVGVELWDSNGTPKRQAWGALSASKTTNSGDTFSIASGSITLALT